MKKKGLVVLALAGVMLLESSIVAFADYEESTSYNANLQYNKTLNGKLDSSSDKIAEYEQKLEDYNLQLESVEANYLGVEEEYNQMLEEGRYDSSLVVKYQKAKGAYTDLQKKIRSAEKVLNSEKSRVATITEQLEEVTDEHMSWTGYTNEGDEDITYTFRLENRAGNWVLCAAYRSWNPLLGGHWEYSSFITDKLDIDLYDGDVCLVSGASRLASFDTENVLYWDVPDTLAAGKKYYIVLNGLRYGLYAQGYSGSYIDKGDYRWDGEKVELEPLNTVTTYWMQNEVGWWVQRSDGTYLVNEWYQSPASGLWYYMGADGYMLTNTITPDGYIVNSEGVWVQ